MKGGKERKSRVSYIKLQQVTRYIWMFNNLFLECSARFLGGSAVPLECYAILVVYKIDAGY